MVETDTRRIDDSTPFHAGTGWMMGGLSLAAAVVVAALSGWPPNVDPNSPDFTPAVFVPVVLGVYGLVQLARAARSRSIGRRFGATVFEMEGHSVRPGATLRGRVVTASDLAAPAGFTLRLRCIERRRLRETAGTGYRDQDRILWEASSQVHAVQSHGAGIPVEFAIPVDADHKAAGDPIRWTLDIESTVDGTRFEALFGVPVAESPGAP